MVSALKSLFFSIKLDWGYSQTERELCIAGSAWCWHRKYQEAQLIWTCEGMTKVAFSFLVENLQDSCCSSINKLCALGSWSFYANRAEIRLYLLFSSSSFVSIILISTAQSIFSCKQDGWEHPTIKRLLIYSQFNIVTSMVLFSLPSTDSCHAHCKAVKVLLLLLSSYLISFTHTENILQAENTAIWNFSMLLPKSKRDHISS